MKVRFLMEALVLKDNAGLVKELRKRNVERFAWNHTMLSFEEREKHPYHIKKYRKQFPDSICLPDGKHGSYFVTDRHIFFAYSRYVDYMNKNHPYIEVEIHGWDIDEDGNLGRGVLSLTNSIPADADKEECKICSHKTRMLMRKLATLSDEEIVHYISNHYRIW